MPPIDPAPPSGPRPWRVAICVPARNEARRLPGLFAALTAQRLPPGCGVTLCLFLDGCTDASAALAAGFARTAPFAVRVRHGAARADANAGRARAAAVAIADDLRAIGDPADDRVAMLTTDADSRPAPDWVAACCRALETCDVVAGRIRREARPAHPVQDRLDAYLDRLHALRRRDDPLPWDAAPGHHGTGGANMAFRMTAYAALGGFPPRAAGEDAAMIDAAHRMGLRVCHDRAAVVTTSARRDGRAVGGLADHLRRTGGGALPMVSDPDGAVWQYRAHAAARAAFAGLDAPGAAAALAARLGIAAAEVATHAREAPNAHAFATRVVPSPPGRDLLTLDAAEAALDRIEGAARDRAA